MLPPQVIDFAGVTGKERLAISLAKVIFGGACVMAAEVEGVDVPPVDEWLRVVGPCQAPEEQSLHAAQCEPDGFNLNDVVCGGCGIGRAPADCDTIAGACRALAGGDGGFTGPLIVHCQTAVKKG